MTHYKIITLAFILSIFLLSNNTIAQQWVNDMMDTNLTLKQKQQSFDSYWSNKEYEKGKGYKPFKRNELFLLNTIGEDGKHSIQQDRLSDYKEAQKQILSNKSIGSAGKWVALGPNGPSNGIGAGRINCIDFHPTNNSKLIIGAPSGGIWRSNDAGSTWTTNTDDLASIGISDIKYAPSNASIIYAATGDIDGDDTYTTGVLKSTDGGNTWNTTGMTYDYQNRNKSYRLLVHPTNPDIVYVTTNKGFFKSVDGGQNWVRKKLGQYKDMEFKTDDPNTIFLAALNRIWLSTDAGETFVNKQTFSNTNRVEIAVTPADPNYVYAIAGNSSNGGFNGLYLSTDGGNTFTQKSSTPNVLGWAKNGNDVGGQAWYDLALAASANNKNKIFVGGVNMWTSSNAGTSWNLAAYWIEGYGVPYIHADIHMIKFSPHYNSTIWACTDGGVSKTSNNGGNWAEENNQLAIAQMYRMGGSRTNANKIMTGWQDNGSSLMTNSWNFVLGGDGMECIISHSNNSTIYGSIYNGDIQRSYNSGSSWVSITNSITETGAWLTPYIMDNNNSNILISGFSNVWKTTNKGNQWTKISSWGSNNYKINALASAGSGSSIIWAANSSNLYKTTDGGQNWTSITANIGGGQVNYIAINKTNTNKVWVCKSGFYTGEKVFQTLDGGNTWTNISGSLPNYPANTIVNAPNTANGLYLGTDLGVYYYDTNLGDWIPFMKDLPNVIVRELELYEQGDKIRAATYGRGLWESVTYPLANSAKSSTKNSISNAKIYPNPATNVIYIEFSELIPKGSKLTVINNLGSIVSKDIVLDKNINLINTAEYPRGIYFLHITSSTESTVNKIIIN